MRSHLSPLDAVFLELEQDDESAHMHVGWALVFEPLPEGGRPSLEKLREQVRDRIGESSILRRRLSSPRVGLLSLPVWLPDPDFDIGRLIGRATLPDPGGEMELTAWLGDYFSQRLDRSRPLWETTLLEGLEGGRWALVSKIHHCLIDGVSGAKLAAALLDVEPKPDEGTTTLSALVSSLGMDSQRMVLARLRGIVGEAISGGIDAALHPHKVLSIVSQSRELAATLAREEPMTPGTSLDREIGKARRLVALDVPLAEVMQVKRELGGNVTDVLLAATAGGLRRLFEDREEDVDSVRAMVPVGLRHAGESLSQGGRLPFLSVDLAVSEPDPLLRHRKVVAARAERKNAVLSGKGLEPVGRLAGLSPPLVQTTIARLTYTPGLFDVTLTNVPAFPATLYGLGTPLRRVVPLAPIVSGHAASVVVTSYDGRLHFGLNADRDTVPDLDLMRSGIEETLHDLSRVAV